MNLPFYTTLLWSLMFIALLKVINWVKKSNSYSRVFWLSLYCRKIYRNNYQLEKRQYLPYYWSDWGWKGTIVNRALSSFHRGSPEITLTVTLEVYEPIEHIINYYQLISTTINYYQLLLTTINYYQLLSTTIN